MPTPQGTKVYNPPKKNNLKCHQSEKTYLMFDSCFYPKEKLRVCANYKTPKPSPNQYLRWCKNKTSNIIMMIPQKQRVTIHGNGGGKSTLWIKETLKINKSAPKGQYPLLATPP